MLHKKCVFLKEYVQCWSEKCLINSFEISYYHIENCSIKNVGKVFG